MSAILYLFPHGATKLLGEQGYELATKTGPFYNARFANPIVGYLQLQYPISLLSQFYLYVSMLASGESVFKCISQEFVYNKA